MGRFSRLNFMSMPKKTISKFFSYQQSPSFNQLQEEPVEVSEVDGVRSLHIGTDTIQSSMRIKDPFFLELHYTKVMALSLLFNDSPNNILTIGLGGASMQKFYFKHCKKAHITALELHQQVINVAYAYFELPNDPRLDVIHGDGISFMVKHEVSYDLILSDAFDEYGIPEIFTTKEYYALCKSRLTEQGLFMINLWGSDPETPQYIKTIKRVFNQQVLFVPAGNPGNIIVMAFRKPPKELRIPVLKEKIKVIEQMIGAELMVYFNRLLENNASKDTHRLKFT
jgi:spermidine synthase